MHQVKGLEFHTVIVVDPTHKNYPMDAEGRRYLYMVTGRAKNLLHFVGNKEPLAQVLRTAVEQNLVEFVGNDDDGGKSVPIVQFSPDDRAPF